MRKTAHGYHFILMFIAVTVAIIGYGLVIPLLSTYKAHFGINAFQMGLVLSLYALGQLISGPFIGDFNKRYSEKQIIILGIIGFAITTFFTFYFSHFYILLFFRFLSGIFASAILIGAETYTATKFKKERITQYVSFLSISGGLGIMLGLFLGAKSLRFSATGVTPVIFGFIIVLLILALLIFLFLPKLFWNEPKVEQDKIPITSYFPNLFKEVYHLSKSKIILFILSGFFLFGYTTSAIEGFVFDFVKITYNFKSTSVLLEISIIAIFILIYFFKINPYLESRLSHITMLLVHTITCTVSLFFLAIFKNIYIFAPSLLIILFTISLFSSVLVAFVSDISENPQLILGTKNSIVSVGMISGPLIGGIFYEIHPTMLFFHLSTIFLVLLIIGIRIIKNHQKHH